MDEMKSLECHCMKCGGLGTKQEAEIARIMGAIDAIGKRNVFDTRVRAIENGTVETVECGLTIFGGLFRASYTFDGRPFKRLDSLSGGAGSPADSYEEHYE